MDIRTEQLESLLRQQELQAKKSTASKNEGAGGFEATLQQEVTLGGAESNVQAGSVPPGAQTSIIGQMLLADAENISTSNVDGFSTEQVISSARGAMDQLESYVQVMREPGQGSLRDAYSALESVASQVQTLKQQSGSLLEQNSELAGIVNELEILTTTEKFKFNRGDYTT